VTGSPDLVWSGSRSLAGRPDTEELFFSDLNYDFDQLALFEEASVALTDRLSPTASAPGPPRRRRRRSWTASTVLGKQRRFMNMVVTLSVKRRTKATVSPAAAVEPSTRLRAHSRTAQGSPRDHRRLSAGLRPNRPVAKALPT